MIQASSTPAGAPTSSLETIRSGTQAPVPTILTSLMGLPVRWMVVSFTRLPSPHMVCELQYDKAGGCAAVTGRRGSGRT
ncbi:hypothetical protein GCM10010335_66130 [Streptomyces galbus]|nr:hypothetical protein GCM10010335_66130 [Streptomyces galbus]